MWKKTVALMLSLLLVFWVGANVQVDAASVEENEESISHALQKNIYKKALVNLTQEQIISNLVRINKSYSVGEVLSQKDQTFVEMYATKVGNGDVKVARTKSVSGSGKANGVTVKVSGNLKDNVQNIINHSFGAAKMKTNTIKGASKVTSVKTVVYHNAYGLVGSGGIAKVYSGTVSTKGKNTVLDAMKKYTGIVVYTYTWCTVTVDHTGGTFTVNPS